MPKPEAQICDDTDNNPVPFNIRKFYQNIISWDEDEAEFNENLIGIDGAQNRIFELMRRIRQKEHKKKVQGKCVFALNPKSQVALSFYSTILPAKKPTSHKVNAENNKLLRSTQRFVC